LNSANCLNEERSLVASLARDDNEKLKGKGSATSLCRDDNVRN